MTIIQQYLDYSTLSFASYGIGLSATGSNDSALKNAKMTQAQIDQLISDGWAVVDQATKGVSIDLISSSTTCHVAHA